MSFIGEEYSDELLESTNRDVVSSSDYYNQEWMKKSTKDIDRTRIDSWLNEYSSGELCLIQHLIGDQLIAFDYKMHDVSSLSWIGLLVINLYKDLLFRFNRLISKYKKHHEIRK